MKPTIVNPEQIQTETGNPNGSAKSTAAPLPAGSTERVRRLRARLLDTTPSLCAERGLLITEAYQKYQADPPVLRRAKALAHILANMTIAIAPDEIIVGNQASAPRAAPLFPEYLVDFLADEIDDFPRRRADVFEVSPEVRASILQDIVPAWRGKTLNDRVMAIMPEDVAAAREELTDRYGPLPAPAQRLLRVAELRIACAAAGLRQLETRGDKVLLSDAHGYCLTQHRFPRLRGRSADEKLAELSALVRAFRSRVPAPAGSRS